MGRGAALASGPARPSPLPTSLSRSDKLRHNHHQIPISHPETSKSRAAEPTGPAKGGSHRLLQAEASRAAITILLPRPLCPCPSAQPSSHASLSWVLPLTLSLLISCPSLVDYTPHLENPSIHTPKDGPQHPWPRPL